VVDRAPSALKFLVGNELRLTREAARLTQASAAKALGWPKSKLSQWESGRNQQREGEVRSMLGLYKASPPDIERIVRLAKQPDDSDWWASYGDVVPDWMRTRVGLEALACKEFVYDDKVINGLLQTKAYATALLDNNLRVPIGDVDRVVDLRLARRQRLDDTVMPLSLHVVLEEAVLLRPVGGSGVFAEQLRHLLELAERDNITVQVIPFEVPVHDGLDGRFTLLHFEEACGIGYVESPDGARYVQEQDHVDGFAKRAARIATSALDEAASRESIARHLAAHD
jgi:transcriptional regulator with XRE-family HTH domain